MSESTSVRQVMTEHHTRVDALLEELQNAAEVGVDARTLGELWTRLDRGLRAHFTAEEQALFPALRAAHPDEVAALEADHVEILRRLGELAVEVDLHVIREPTVRALLDRLRAHAAREDEGIYRWAGREVADAGTPGFLGRLGDLLRT